jgi:hypothetical protein
MPVVKRGNNLAFHIGETPETVIRLKKNFGKDNVYERPWYTKKYDVNGKQVPVIMAASFSKLMPRQLERRRLGEYSWKLEKSSKREWKWTPSDRNRDDRRAVMNQAKSNYGMYGKHATKHIRTKKDRKKEKLNRVCGQRASRP